MSICGFFVTRAYTSYATSFGIVVLIFTTACLVGYTRKID